MGFLIAQMSWKYHLQMENILGISSDYKREYNGIEIGYTLW